MYLEAFQILPRDGTGWAGLDCCAVRFSSHAAHAHLQVPRAVERMTANDQHNPSCG
jgi:hypothetical protein